MKVKPSKPAAKDADAIKLTTSEWAWIRVAVRLRAEAAEENAAFDATDERHARKWRGILAKLSR